MKITIAVELDTTEERATAALEATKAALNPSLPAGTTVVDAAVYTDLPLDELSRVNAERHRGEQ